MYISVQPQEVSRSMWTNSKDLSNHSVICYIHVLKYNVSLLSYICCLSKMRMFILGADIKSSTIFCSIQQLHHVTDEV